MKLFGGKKGTRGKTAHKQKKTSTKRGGKSCKGNRGRRTGRKTRKQKGGMFGTMSAVAKTALVPFGLFAAQKMVQRRRRTSRR